MTPLPAGSPGAATSEAGPPGSVSAGAAPPEATSNPSSTTQPGAAPAEGAPTGAGSSGPFPAGTSFEAALFEAAPTPLLAVDPDGLVVVAASRSARQLLDVAPGSALWPLVALPEGRDGQVYKERFITPKPAFTARFRTSRGIRPFAVRAGALEWDGRRRTLFGLTDISILRRGQSRLRNAFREAQGVLRAAALILVGCDGRRRVVKWNAQAEQVFGLGFEQACGRPLEELPLGWDPQAVADSMAACQRRQASVLLADLRYTRPDGKVGFLKLTFRPLARTVARSLAQGPEEALGAEAAASSVLMVGEEITQYKILEQQLLQAQKLESIGQLASGIAHEINTPIQYVSGNLGFLQEAFQGLLGILGRYQRLGERLARNPAAIGTQPGPAAELEAELAAIGQATAAARLDELAREIPESIADSIIGVDRVSTIVGAMKKFSHPDAAGKRLVDVNKAIESTLTISRNEWKYDADLEIRLAPDLPLVLCVPGDFNQVILNVLVNAAHAVSERYHGTGERGRITVATAQEGDAVRISIGDTGVGIPEENRSRIFDPFFTTKEVGRGTGQGLAIVHSIVTRHGGSVDFDSLPGQGATFHIRFPIGQEVRA